MGLMCAAVAVKSFNLRGIVQFEPPLVYIIIKLFLRLETTKNPVVKSNLPQSRKVLWGFVL